MTQPSNPNHFLDERLLRLEEVCHRVGFSKSTIYKLIKDGKFPKQRKPGARTSVWLLSDVLSYMHNGMAEGSA